jgi:hypothetical protein
VNDLHGLENIQRSLQSIVDEASYNEGQGASAEGAEQHYEIAMSLVEQAISHLKIARLLEGASTVRRESDRNV